MALTRRQHEVLEVILTLIDRNGYSPSLEEIGAFFGGRDHTTVLHAERKISKQMQRDPAFCGLVESIEQHVLRP